MDMMYELPTQLSFNFKDQKNVDVNIVFSGLYINFYAENLSLLANLIDKYELPFSIHDNYISVKISQLMKLKNIDFLVSSNPEWLVLKKLIIFNERGLLPNLLLSSPKELMIELKFEGRRQLYFTPISFFNTLYVAGIKFHMEYQLEEYFKENILPYSNLGIASQSNDTHWEIILQSPNLIKYLTVEGLFIIDSLTVGVPSSLSWQLLRERKIWVQNPDNVTKETDEISKFNLNKAGIIIGNSINDFKSIIEKNKDSNILIIVEEEMLLYWELWLVRNIEEVGEMGLILTNINGLNSNVDYHSYELVIIDLQDKSIFSNRELITNVCSDLITTVIFHFSTIEIENAIKVLGIAKGIEFPNSKSMESVSLVSMRHNQTHLYEYLYYSEYENDIVLTKVPLSNKYAEIIREAVETKEIEKLKLVYFEGIDEEINPLILFLAARNDIDGDSIIIVGNENMKILLENIKRNLAVVTILSERELSLAKRVIILGYSKNLDSIKKALTNYKGSIEIIILDSIYYRDMMIYIDSHISNKVVNSLTEVNLDSYFENLV